MTGDNFLKNAEVSFLPSVYCEKKDMETRSLAELVLSATWKMPVEQVRNEPDAEKRMELKRNLPCFMPSGVFSHKGEDGLQRHSGYVCVDIDAKDNVNVSDFDRLKSRMAHFPYVAYCGHSVGGSGYFCLVLIACPGRHAEHYEALVEDFRQSGITVDKACRNVCSKRYVSYDPEPYLNPSAQAYDRLPVGGPPRRTWNSVWTRKPVFSGNDDEMRLRELLVQIHHYQVDITQGYPQWFQILSGIANTYGEYGRPYAHELSRYHPKYSRQDTDRQYDKCLKHRYKYGMNTVFHFAKLVMSDLNCWKPLGRHAEVNFT